MTAPDTGADALVRAARDRGAEVCFANPGTTEMPLVGALDRVGGIRAVLGLHENVCTGAADGWGRLTGRPALTLLHLGPGLANGLANLHNARRANTPIVNVVGDHASWHLPFDAALTSDIAAVAATVGTVHTADDRSGVTAAVDRAWDDALQLQGVATVIVPADHQQESLPAERRGEGGAVRTVRRLAVEPARVSDVAAALEKADGHAVVLIGGSGLSARALRAAATIAEHTGATLYSETFPARAERGGGLPDVDRLPYFPETAVAALADARCVVLAGAEEPVAYFGYPDIPSLLSPPGTVTTLARPHEDATAALEALATEVRDLPVRSERFVTPPPPVRPDDDATLTGVTVGRTVAAALPDGAIVSVEGGTCGYPFVTASAGAAAHTVLTNTGGAIGQGLPVALGAAIAAPDRPVIALQSDGSGLYTAQALWTMSRERCHVVVLIAANHVYNVLRTELDRHGIEAPGPAATSLTSLGDPTIDWVALSTAYGVPAVRVHTAGELRAVLATALASTGPHLVEMALEGSAR